MRGAAEAGAAEAGAAEAEAEAEGGVLGAVGAKGEGGSDGNLYLSLRNVQQSRRIS